MLIDRRVISNFDWTLLGLIFIVPFFGLIVLYSAGYEPDKTYLNIGWLGESIHSLAFLKQISFLAAGTVVMLIALSLPASLLSRYANIFYGACIVLLIAVLLVGTVSNGSRRWLNFGAFNLQPSELAKLGTILVLARYLSRNPARPGGYGLKELMVPLLLIGVPMGLIIDQPDLGTALSLGTVGGLMVLFMGIRPKTLLLGVLAVVVLAVPAWESLHDYQKRRVMTLFNPEADPLGSGYHVIQSKIAVGSGSLTGKGYLRGTQSQLEFLPEHTTDFVFSVLAEEWGFFGCAVVLTFYLLLLFKILAVISKSKDLFSSLLAFGIGSQLFFHTIINIGMVIGILPVVGIPLPLFSYGGSSMLSVMFSLGLVLGVSMRRYSNLRNP